MTTAAESGPSRLESRLPLLPVMRYLILLLLSVPLSAQLVSVGVKAGIPFGDPLGTNRESRPYVIGPTVEVRLPAGFAVEASALYRRLGQSYAFSYAPESGVLTSINNRIRGNAWEFPVVGKYYFKSPESSWQPFFGTGWSLRTIDWKSDGATITTGPNGQVVTPFHTSDRSGLNVGATFAAGVRLRVSRFSVLPELRYTRWGGVDGTQRRNEGGFFLGFRF
jgi:hypothetical protein